MSILTAGLPVVDRQGNPVQTNFRNMMQLESVLADSSVTDVERAVKALSLLYGDTLPRMEVGAAIDELWWFYLCGEEKPKPGTGKSGALPYDFEQDANYIYASFLQAYGVHLTCADLHWWEFRALFSALPEDTLMRKIMHWRGADVSKLPKSQKKFYEQMRRTYALKKRGATPEVGNMKSWAEERFAQVQKAVEVKKDGL